MTEILISDSMQKDAKRYVRRQRYYLLEEWLENNGTAYRRDFLKRAEKMGIDLTISYRVMVLLFASTKNFPIPLKDSGCEQMEATIRHETERQQILYLREPTRQICILPWCSSEHMAAVAEEIQ